MTDPRVELLDRLIQLSQANLRDLRNGRLDFTDTEDPRDELLERLRALDRELGPPVAAPLPDRLAELQRLNDVLQAELRRVLDETRGQIKGLSQGRKGIKGYLGTARGANPGAKLGRG